MSTPTPRKSVPGAGTQAGTGRRYNDHIYRIRGRSMPRGYRPAWRSRLWDTWHCLIGSHSLHLAWQVGFDEGQHAEYQRVVINKGG